MDLERAQYFKRSKQHIRDSMDEAKIFMKRYDRLSSMKLEDFSEKQISQLERFINFTMKDELFFLDDDNRFDSARSKKSSLTDRFDAAQKDNPSLTYDQIYKDMKVDLNSDDPDDYKDAEDRWLKKHGY